MDRLSAGEARVTSALAAESHVPGIFARMNGPQPLGTRGMGLPKASGVYVVTCGRCLAHIGVSGNLRARVGTLARLGTHGGAGEVLCAAFCTGQRPQIWWRECDDSAAAREERALKAKYGEPPQPRQDFEACRNGGALRTALIGAAGAKTWEAGYIEAVFATGAHFNLLGTPRLLAVWRRARVPDALLPWIGHFLGSEC
jgi:hypothetical protein